MLAKLKRECSPSSRDGHRPDSISPVYKVLDPRGQLVFKRIQRFYQTFNIISTLLGGLSLAVMTFQDFQIGDHDLPRRLIDVSAGFLTSSVLTAVIAVMLATILLFRFEGHDMPTRLDLAVSWVPLVLVDLVILEFLIGLMVWYAARYSRGAVIAMASQLVILLSATITIAIWVWNSMSARGGLGEEERSLSGQLRRVADAETDASSDGLGGNNSTTTWALNAPSNNTTHVKESGHRSNTWSGR